MKIDVNQIISISVANQNFSAVAKQADKRGTVYIFKHNKPKYKLVDVERNEEIYMTVDEKIDFVAKRVLNEYRSDFEELAK